MKRILPAVVYKTQRQPERLERRTVEKGPRNRDAEVSLQRDFEERNQFKRPHAQRQDIYWRAGYGTDTKDNLSIQNLWMTG